MKKTVFMMLLFFTVLCSYAAELGDVNEDQFINIIDALMVARHYVGIEVPQLNPGLADVNLSGSIDIIDALLIAQYYVGLISALPPGIFPTPNPSPLNWDALQNFLTTGDMPGDMLKANGFVLLESHKEQTVTELYNKLSVRYDIPAFITADSMLHLFHLTYSHMIKTVEKYVLAPKQKLLVTNIHSLVTARYPALITDTVFSESISELWIFTAVARALANQELLISAEPPSGILQKDIICAQGYLDKILSASPPDANPPEGDFTEYLPRGNYEEHPDLESYFRCVKWLQKRQFPVFHEYNNQIALKQLKSAAILGTIIKSNSDLTELWNYLHNIKNRLVNTSSSFTPISIADTIISIGGITADYRFLSDSTHLYQVQEALLNDSSTPDKWVELLGEPYLADANAMRETVHNKVPNRYMPVTMDFASTVIASDTAYSIYYNFLNLPDNILLNEQINYLRNSVYPTFEWETSTYNRWYYLLKALSAPVSGDLPDYFTQEKWERRKLNTQMASWTELRSDTSKIVQIVNTPTPTPTPTQTPPVTPTPVPLATHPVLYYACANPNETSNQIQFKVQIKNNSNAPVDLKSLSFRYYYSRTASDVEIFNVDYSTIGSSNITGTFEEDYIEIGFTAGAGTMPPGGNSGEIIIRIHKTDWSIYSQSEDYSFNPNISDYTLWPHIPLYMNHTLIWGSEPNVVPTITPGTTPTPVILPTQTPSITVPPTPTPTPPPGFVEPDPEFFQRYADLCGYVIGVLDETTPIDKSRFQMLKNWAMTFKTCAEKIQNGVKLSASENESIRTWGAQLKKNFFNSPAFIQDERSVEVQLAADIFSNEDKVLHIATGKLNPIIILIDTDNGNTLAAVGLCLSYFEFIKNDYVRLRDEDWKLELTQNPPARPFWLTDILAE